MSADVVTSAAPALLHVLIVGGDRAEWAALSEAQWTQRLTELGKVADHSGAHWLTIRPYHDGQPAPNELDVRRAEVAGCVVLASPTADGRARLVEAANALGERGEAITEQALMTVLNAPALVDPDLVVVLGPADRLPPSLVWELAYSELVFLDIAWIDLQAMHLESAIEEYTHRHRRFGGLD